MSEPIRLFSRGDFDAKYKAMVAVIDAKERRLDGFPAASVCPEHGVTTVLDRDRSLHSDFPIYTCSACVEQDRGRRRDELKIAAGIPEDVLSATLDAFQTQRGGIELGSPEDFLRKARRLAAGEIRNLILCGSPGIGKGHIAAAIAGERIARGRSVRWVSCSQLFRQWHRAYPTNSNDAIAERYGLCSLLVLDECGLRELPKDGEECLFEIFDMRQKRGLQSILLGNMQLESFKTWIGERIRDRLNVGSVAFSYGAWDSFRPLQADAENRI